MVYVDMPMCGILVDILTILLLSFMCIVKCITVNIYIYNIMNNIYIYIINDYVCVCVCLCVCVRACA